MGQRRVAAHRRTIDCLQHGRQPDRINPVAPLPVPVVGLVKGFDDLQLVTEQAAIASTLFAYCCTQLSPSGSGPGRVAEAVANGVCHRLMSYQGVDTQLAAAEVVEDKAVGFRPR